MRQVLEVRWETNVRELEALVWRALDQGEGAVLDAVLVAPPRTRHAPPEASEVEASPPNEAERIQACLDRHNGVIEDAWRELGLSSRYVLRRLIAKHRLVVRRQSGR
jgi:transcriptional regulator with GAF, ATPase, and Fis domain